MRVSVEARGKPTLEFDSNKGVHTGTTTCSHVHSSAAGNNHLSMQAVGEKNTSI
jgi:hypothetical protein